MIVKLATGELKTKFGTFQEALYYDGQKESIALFMGDLKGAEEVLCRVHSSCIFGHYFNSVECNCQAEMDISQQLIAGEGRGIIILLEQEGKGNGHFALLNSVRYKREGISQGEAYQAAGFSRDARDFRAAAKIIRDLEIASVRLLTDNPGKVGSLRNHGIEVKGSRPIRL